jgi:hypothetical protein
MKILPRTRDEWIALALLPFKAYAVVALPLFMVFHRFASVRIDGRSSDMHVFMGTYTGYLLRIAVLLFAAVVQAGICQRGAAARTLAFLGCAVLFLVFLFHG